MGMSEKNLKININYLKNYEIESPMKAPVKQNFSYRDMKPYYLKINTNITMFKNIKSPEIKAPVDAHFNYKKLL